MILEIKQFPTNNTIAEVSDFTVSESFMDIKSLSAKLESPVKIRFTPYSGVSYNYIDYNNNRYYLFIDPTVKDDNNTNKIIYNFDFKGFEYILKLIPFNDIVKSGGNSVYTNSGIVSLFGNTQTIAQFINANLETYFGNKTTFQVIEDFSSSFDPLLYPDQYFSFLNQNCWDAVKSINEVLKLNFFVNTSVNGTSYIVITDKVITLPHIFKQGDNNGLYNIGKAISNEDELLTVIRPTGGNRNINPKYKKTSNPIDESRYSPYLLLPDVNGNIRYEIRNEAAIQKYGVRIKSITDPFQGIYPSIQNATLKDIYGTPLPSIGNDGVSLIGLNANDRVDRIIGCEFNPDSRFFTLYTTDLGFNLEKKASEGIYFEPTDYDVTGSVQDTGNLSTTGVKEFVIYQNKLNKESEFIFKLSGLSVSGNITPYEASNNCECTLVVYKNNIAAASQTVTLSGSEMISFTPLSITANGAADFKVSLFVSNLYSQSIRVQLYYSNFLVNVSSTTPKPSYIYYTNIDSVISMRTGLYAGQEFKIQEGKVTKISSGNPFYSKGARYSIVLERNEDGTDIEGNPYLVPTEKLKENDNFVILGINMPQVYVSIAENRLLQAATEYLNKYCVPQYTVPLEISTSFFVENQTQFNNFRAGNRLKVYGEDIDLDVEEFTIQSYSLQYTKDNKYPKYNVNLSEVKTLTLLDQLNSVTNSISKVEKKQQKSEQKPSSDTTIIGESYFKKVETDSSGDPIDVDKQYIITPYSTVSEKDIICYGIDPIIEDIEYPVAGYNTKGIVQIKINSGIIVDVNGIISIDPNYIGGGGGGLDETKLKKYLDDNHYLTPSGKLFGYVPLADNPLITDNDTVNEAFKKLENNIGKFVTLDTPQTITGQKTFSEYILGEKDIICYAKGTIEDVYAVATPDTYGLIKFDPTKMSINASGQLTISGDIGGGGLNDVVSSGTGNAVTSLMYSSTTKILTYIKDSNFALLTDIPTALRNPFSLSWSGYSSGTYDGSSARSISIPNNTNQLINSAGYITGINLAMVNNALQENGIKYIGNSSNSSYVNIQEDLRVLQSCNFSVRPTVGGASVVISTDLNAYVTLGTTQTITGAKTFTQNVVSQGDIVAYSVGGITDVTAIASASTYGLVKIDNNTIRMNASGQLYSVGGGGGGGVNVIDNLNSTSTIDALSANQGRLIDGRLKSVNYGTATTDYVTTNLGAGSSYNLSRYGHAHTWAEITSKPTGLVTAVSISGSGNAIGSASFSGGTLSLAYTTISGGSGSTSSLASDVVLSSGTTVFRSIGNSLGIRMSGGNTIYGHDTSQSGSIGNLYLNYVSSSVNVRVDNAGRIYSNGTQVTSDLRLKTIVGYECDVLDKMLQIPVIRYFRNDIKDKEITVGFGAQNFIGVFDDAVRLNDDSGKYGINTEVILGITFQGIKELYYKHKELDNLVKSRKMWESTKDSEIEQLRREVVKQKEQILDLERRLSS